MGTEQPTVSYAGDLRELVTDAYEPLGRQPVYIYCPAHEDVLRPSLAVYADHAFCYTCRTRYDREQFSALFDDAHRVRAAIFRRTHARSVKPPQHLNIPLLVQTAHQALVNLPQYHQQRVWLYCRGISMEVIEAFRLGYTGSAFTLPYFVGGDSDRPLVRFRRDDSVDGASKMLPKYWGIAGYNKTDIFPLPCPKSTGIVLTEGEFDALLVRRLWGAGLAMPAISFTNGAQALPADDELKRMLEGVQRVALLRDQDAAGRAGTQKLQEALHRVFPHIHTTDVTWEVEEVGGKDITEVWQHDSSTAAMLVQRAVQTLH